MNADELVTHSYIRTRNGRILIERRSGGNPGLRPFDAKTFNLGLVTGLGPFRLSIDRFRIEETDKPGLLSTRTILQRFLTGSGLPEGVRVLNWGQPGVIPTVISPWVNVLSSTRSGIDMRVHTGWSSGSVDWSFDTRWMRITDSRSGDFGMLEEDDLVPRDRLYTTIRARRGNLTASWSANAVSRFRSGIYEDYYPSWTGHDVALSWQNAFGYDRLVVTGGVLNVTDSGPPILPSAPRLFTASYDALLGRTLFLSTKIAW